MRFRNVLALVALVTLPGIVRAQDSLQAAQQQMQIRAMVEKIMRDRPAAAEAAAREMFTRLQILQASIDSLRAKSLDQYWAEVAQLTVQHQMLAQAQDSARRALMAQMFGAEYRARELQRQYREATDSVIERRIRIRLETVLDRHLAAEDSLRRLEIAEIERRLAQVRAETERRRREREVLVRQMVEQVLRDARRP